MTKHKKAVDGRDIKVYLSDSQINIATLIGGGGARDTSKGNVRCSSSPEQHQERHDR